MAISIGFSVLSSSVTLSKDASVGMPSRGAPQSPGAAPAAHSIAPWMCWRYSGSCQAEPL